MKITKNSKVAVDVSKCTFDQKQEIDMLIGKWYGVVDGRSVSGIRKMTTITTDYGYMDRGREYDERFYKGEYKFLSYSDFLKAINPYAGKIVYIQSACDDITQRCEDLGYVKNFTSMNCVMTKLTSDMNYELHNHKGSGNDMSLTFEQFMALELPGEAEEPIIRDGIASAVGDPATKKCPDCINGLVDRGDGCIVDCRTCDGSGEVLHTRPNKIPTFKSGDKVVVRDCANSGLPLWSVYLVGAVSDDGMLKLRLQGDTYYCPSYFCYARHDAQLSPIITESAPKYVKTDCFVADGCLWFASSLPADIAQNNLPLSLCHNELHEYNIMSKEEFDAKYPSKLMFGKHEVLLDTPEPGYVKIGCQPVKVESLKGFYEVLDIIKGQKNKGEVFPDVSDIHRLLKKYAKDLGI